MFGLFNKSETPAPVKPKPAAAAPAEAVARSLPEVLAAFKPVSSRELPPGRADAIVKVFHNVPRPPKLLHQLLSPDFVAHASSAELADLIVAEPMIAAKVLATINSPLYALRQTVGNVDQAVTLLGLTNVRAICLQYLLINAFKADSPERQAMLDATWRASALASEITLRLGQGMGYPEVGSLVSQVVLSFLGRLATAAAMPRALLAKIPARGLLQRAVAEQQSFGVTAAQVGHLLMTHWGLPEALCAQAEAVDAVLFTPASGQEDPVHAARLALCYLAARLGERLALEPGTELAKTELATDPDAEFFHLAGYLEIASFSTVQHELKSASLNEAVQRLRAGFQA